MRQLNILFFILLFPVLLSAQSDFNYEYVTNGYITTTQPDPSDSTQLKSTTQNEKVRISKSNARFTVISNDNLGDIKLSLDVRFIGRNGLGEFVYEHLLPNKQKLRIFTNPMDHFAYISLGRTIVAEYGSKEVYVPIK